MKTEENEANNNIHETYNNSKVDYKVYKFYKLFYQSYIRNIHLKY